MSTSEQVTGYDISLTDDGQIVVCRVHRPVTVALAAAFARAMDETGEACGAVRFLTDVQGVPNVSRTGENYNYAHADMAKIGLRRAVRAAILADPSDSSHAFIETVSQNAGYNMRVFYDPEEAMTWLRGGA